MEVQLQELVDRIKEGGIAPAREKATQIVSEAEEKARSIVAAAEEEAKSIVQSARLEAERFEKASEAAVLQASRNTLISFKDQLLAMLSGLIQKDVSKNYNQEMLKKLIPTVVTEWAKNPNNDNIAVMLSPEDVSALEESLVTELKKVVESGVTVCAEDAVNGGFRIGTKDGVAYYDFSASAVAELFSSYVSPKVACILTAATKEV